MPRKQAPTLDVDPRDMYLLTYYCTDCMGPAERHTGAGGRSRLVVLHVTECPRWFMIRTRHPRLAASILAAA